MNSFMTEVQWTGFYMIGTSTIKELKSSKMSFFWNVTHAKKSHVEYRGYFESLVATL